MVKFPASPPLGTPRFLASGSGALRGDGSVYVDTVQCTGSGTLPTEPVLWRMGMGMGWKPMEISGKSMGKTMEISGKPMEIHGNLREIYGNLWISVGFLWISVGLLLDSNVLWNLFKFFKMCWKRLEDLWQKHSLLNEWQVSPRSDHPLELFGCWFESAPGFYHDYIMVIFPLNRSTQLATNSTQVVKVVLHCTWIPVGNFKHRPGVLQRKRLVGDLWHWGGELWWQLAGMAREILAGFRTFNINELLFKNKMQKPTHISVQICLSVCLFVLSCPVLSCPVLSCPVLSCPSVCLSACLCIYLKSNLI